MNLLSDVLNSNQFLKFFKENRSKTINLFTVVEDKEVGKEYFQRMQKLESFIEYYESGIIPGDDVEKFLFEKDRENCKQILIIAYKALNSHFIDDFSIQDLIIAHRYEGELRILLSDGCLENGIEESDIVGFKNYSLTMKAYRSPVRFESSTVVQDEEPQEFNDFNRFFGFFGYYYPNPFRNKMNIVQENLTMFNFIPEVVPSGRYQNPTPELKYDTRKSFLDYYMSSILDAVKALFFNLDIDIEIKLTTEILKAGDRYAKVSPDITVLLRNEIKVPIELQCHHVREQFESFLYSEDESNVDSWSFVELFSRGFLSALACNSGCFILADSEFCVGVVLDNIPLENANISRPMTGISCQIICCDSLKENISIPMFMMMIILKYAGEITAEAQSTLKLALLDLNRERI